MTQLFRGTYTALITPFKRDQSVDWDALERVVEFQIEKGISGLVPCGTTGESPTLSHTEHNQVIERVVRIVSGRCQVIAGTGSNCTDETIGMSRFAEEVGADACMLVNPYYNRPTQEGLFRHFTSVADQIAIPLIVYNILGRTAVNLETKTLLRVIERSPNVRGIKEASGNIEQIKEVIERTPEDFAVLSGDDGITLALLQSGGDGVISVTSNLLPSKMVAMVDAALSQDRSEAERLNAFLDPIFRGSALETNPIPIKTAMAQAGFCDEVFRLPLCEMSPANRDKWLEVLAQCGVIDL